MIFIGKACKHCTAIGRSCSYCCCSRFSGAFAERCCARFARQFAKERRKTSRCNSLARVGHKSKRASSSEHFDEFCQHRLFLTFCFALCDQHFPDSLASVDALQQFSDLIGDDAQRGDVLSLLADVCECAPPKLPAALKKQIVTNLRKTAVSL